jgi:SAM-dependent methyltransferase
MTPSWWSSTAQADTYASLRNPLEWQLAYPALFDRIDLGAQTCGPVLDYGCGPGVVASFIADTFGHEVVGCDISSDMIDMAVREASRPGVRYLGPADESLDEFPDEHFGVAICTFVLCVLGRGEQHLAMIRELHRLLKADAPVGLIAPHPDSMGIQFSTCRSGDPGVRYVPGDPMTTRLTGNGKSLVINDYYWPAEWYEKLLVECGFHSVDSHSPKADAGEPDAAPRPGRSLRKG